jgi:hypothetical protein
VSERSYIAISLLLLLLFCRHLLVRLDFIFVFLKVNVIDFFVRHDSLHLTDIVLIESTILESLLVISLKLHMGLHWHTLGSLQFKCSLIVLQLLWFCHLELHRALSLQSWVRLFQVIVLVVSCISEQLLLFRHQLLMALPRSKLISLVSLLLLEATLSN